MQHPCIVIAGTHSGSGKTTITAGLMRALVRRGKKVQGFKVGPDYIDPAFHQHVTKRPSRNLDIWMCGEDHVKSLYLQGIQDSDIAVIEGVMGMFDGVSSEKGIGSTAHVAKLLKAPVILVVDGSGVATSAAAMVQGYANFDPDVKLAGVIFNNLHGERHYTILKHAVETYAGIPCVGYMNKNKEIKLESRHLGLVPAEEVLDLDVHLNRVADMVEETIAIDDLEGIAMSDVDEQHRITFEKRFDLRIAVPKDSAFSFYYQDNLDLLSNLGAQLVYFSPLEDNKLPENIQGIYIGGGFPEVFAEKLSNNREMLGAIRAAAENKMPIYAECGGLMYLSKSITDLAGKLHSMVGALNVDTEMTKRLQRFGYVDVTFTEDTLLGEKGTKVRAHEFHRSKCVGENVTAYEVKRERPWKTDIWHCGLIDNQIFAGYAHIHFYTNPEVAINYLRKCADYSISR